jgi:HD-GYP domain-containing protein (c-di-GMP phosphodiesterase class II)
MDMKAHQTDDTNVRLAELVAALSLGIDLGFGQPMEHVLRQTLIALRLAERIGLGPEERSDVYYTSLLVGVGCHTDAHEQAKWFGDDLELKSDKYDHELRSLRAAMSGMRKLGAGSRPLHRFRIGLEFMLTGHKEVDKMIDHHASMARLLGAELGFDEQVLAALSAAYERWDGRGWPGNLKGGDVPVASRIAQLAEFVEVAQRIGGVEGAKKIARDRAGKHFDPNLAGLVQSEAEVLLAEIGSAQTWEEVIDAEPALAVTLSGERFDGALTAVANFVDLKSPYFLGHARAVADLSDVAARELGFPQEEANTIRRAALVSGLGRLGVSNAIWDKRGRLGPGEWERVRMHPYLTERMLRQSKALRPLGVIAAQLRERLDGSGYPAGLSGAAISQRARILAAADAYQSMREPRPYREAHEPEQAASELRAEVTAGQLDADAVEAVLRAAGHRVQRRREGPAGLTTREVEVLRLAARGLPNKQIAERLTISPKTVGNHIEHIYTKIGVSSRAMASLFAMQHGLLPEEQFVPAESPRSR